MKFIAVVLTLVGIAGAATCPGEIKWARVGYDQTTRQQSLYVILINRSEKNIVGAKFGLQYLDAVGDPQGSIFDYTTRLFIKPNKKEHAEWTLNPGDILDPSRGSVTWLKKVLFQDGSTWEDDNSKKCMLTDRK